MKAWNVVHQSFPRESVNSYIQRNKLDKSYTSYYSIQTSNLKPLDPPSQSCTLLRDKIIRDWKGIFKEKLEKKDRLNIAPVSLNLKEGSIPSYQSRAYDTPYHLREPYDRELNDMMQAGILEPMALRESEWCSRAFPVLKGDGHKVRLVTDFKALNKCIKRPHHPTDSADRLLRQIKSTSRYFCTIDMLSAYHQCPV